MSEVLALVEQALNSPFALFLLIVLVLWAGYRRIWVWGWQYEQARQAAEHWQATAVAASRLLQEAIDVAKRES